MESEKLVLREKQGRKVVYREILVPTFDEMLRVATELHAVQKPSMRDLLGWRVVYEPSFPIRYTAQDVDPFTFQPLGSPIQHESRSVSHCTFGHKQIWGVTLSWANGDNKPPVKCNERGDVLRWTGTDLEFLNSFRLFSSRSSRIQEFKIRPCHLFATGGAGAPGHQVAADPEEMLMPLVDNEGVKA